MAWAKNGTSYTEASGSDDMDITDLGGKKFNQFMIHTTGSANFDLDLTFNNDITTYARRFSNDGGSDITAINEDNVELISVGGTSNTYFGIIYQIGISSEEKLGINFGIESKAVGATNVPSRTERVFKWDDTSSTIDRIDLNNPDSGSYPTGSNLSALTGDETEEAILGNNVQSGSRFEATDTRKIYYGALPSVTYETDFSSSTGWTQVGTWVQISGGKVVFSGGSNANHNVNRAIGTTLSNTKWVMRFKYNSGVTDFGYMVLSSGTSNPDSDTTDWIGLYAAGSTNNSYTLAWGDSGSMNIGGWIGTSNFSANTDYWVQITRESATSAKLEMFSDAGYSVLVGTSSTTSLPSSITGISNIIFSSITEGGASSGYSWEVDDLKIYNGVTSTDFTWTEEV